MDGMISNEDDPSPPFPPFTLLLPSFSTAISLPSHPSNCDCIWCISQHTRYLYSSHLSSLPFNQYPASIYRTQSIRVKTQLFSTRFPFVYIVLLFSFSLQSLVSLLYQQTNYYVTIIDWWININKTLSILIITLKLRPFGGKRDVAWQKRVKWDGWSLV